MTPDSLAVQSYCFRGFKDPAEVAEKVREIGLSKIELCAVHVDFLDESAFGPVIGAFADAGVEIISIGVQGFRNEPEKEEKFFQFASEAGATTISADFNPTTVPEAYRVAEQLAEKYDLRLAIHNHGGRHWLGPAQMLSLVLEQTSPRIGLMLDTAWALDSREDPLALVDRFADRLYGLHLKDFIFERDRTPTDVVVGTGNLKLPELMAKLKQRSFQGHLILEYEGDVENPVPALTKCVAAIQAQM